jgi:hypothetical protein
MSGGGEIVDATALAATGLPSSCVNNNRNSQGTKGEGVGGGHSLCGPRYSDKVQIKPVVTVIGVGDGERVVSRREVRREEELLITQRVGARGE